MKRVEIYDSEQATYDVVCSDALTSAVLVWLSTKYNLSSS